MDKNGGGFELAIQLEAEEVKVVTLSGAPGTAQLSNKGGSIALVDSGGTEIHKVIYTKSKAKRTKQGKEMKFNKESEATA